MRRAAALLLLAGCQASHRLVLPEVEGAQTLLVAVGAAPAVYVQDLSSQAEIAPVSLGPEDALQVLYFERPPLALALAPGPWAGPTPGGLPLSVPDRALRWVGGERSFVDSTPEELQALRDRIRVPEVDFETCAAEGGCLVPDEVGARCEYPCPAVAEPRPPEAPNLPCPVDWVPSPGPQGLTLCHPRLPDRLGCLAALGLFQPYGAETCQPLGPPCEGRFARLDGIAAPLYVDPEAPAGGDGSQAAPLRDLSLAVMGVAAGGTIALSVGDHLGPIRIDRADVQLIGACAPGTRILGGNQPAVSVAAPRARLSALSLKSDQGPSLWVAGSAVLQGARTGSVLVAGGTLDLEEVFVGGAGSPLIGAGPGSVLGLQTVVVDASGRPGVVFEGAELTGDGVVIEGPSVGWIGYAGSTGAVGRAQVEGASEWAVQLSGTASLEAAPTCGTPPGATLVSFSDLRVRARGNHGAGVQLLCGARLRSTGAALLELDNAALTAGAGTEFLVQDWLVQDGADYQGYGLLVVDGAIGRVQRALFESRASVPIGALEEGTVLDLSDVLVQSEGPSDDAIRYRRSRATLGRVWLSGQGRFDLRTGPELIANDLFLFDSTSEIRLAAEGGGRVTRVAVESLPGAQLGLELSACNAADECNIPGLAFTDLRLSGSAVGISFPRPLSVTTLTRFHLQDHGVTALEMLFPVSITLKEGVVESSRVGITTSAGDYAFGQIFEQVIFRDIDQLRRSIVP